MKLLMGVTIYKTVEINPSPNSNLEKYIKAWLTDEDDRTNKEWELIENHSLDEMVSKYLGEDVTEAELYSVEK